MTTYLCTTGTSASQILPEAVPDGPRRLTPEVIAEWGGEEATFKRLWPLVRSFDYHDDVHLRTKLSAEIHALCLLGVNPEDRVCLFHSDTPDGAICARLVAEYLRVRMNISEVETTRIAGLQVNDAARFRREGVPNLFRALIREGERCAWQNIVFNATGGFKAAAPYTTLAGMFFGVDIAYVFDNGRELVRMPRFPVEFDEVRLSTLLKAMQRIEDQSGIPEHDFWGATPHADRALYEYLIEPPDKSGRVTLSGIGILVLERLRARSPLAPLQIYLSREAWDDFLSGPKEWNVPGFLRQLRTRADVDRFRHPVSDGALWLKPGNTSDRYRVELEGNRLLVYRILKHDDYEEYMRRAWNRRDYAPFIYFDYVE